ncbi:MAG: sodium/proton-translocating pyrophosphatase, partial [Kofleriaceae bacterium]|nr:sodium/proton-translocating pyrophosphatase [Kofleriaceae bacterium]
MSITSWLANLPALASGAAGDAAAAAAHNGVVRPHSEADLVLPDFSQIKFLGLGGQLWLAIGIGICVLGILFGMSIYAKLKNAPVHSSMKEISELIYETCKTYLRTQVKFIAVLWGFIATVIVVYFAVLEKVAIPKVAAIAAFSIIGILGSVAVAAFGIRVNNFANSRAAFAALRGKPYPCYAIPLQAGMSIGT